MLFARPAPQPDEHRRIETNPKPAQPHQDTAHIDVFRGMCSLKDVRCSRSLEQRGVDEGPCISEQRSALGMTGRHEVQWETFCGLQMQLGPRAIRPAQAFSEEFIHIGPSLRVVRFCVGWPRLSLAISCAPGHERGVQSSLFHLMSRAGALEAERDRNDNALGAIGDPRSPDGIDFRDARMILQPHSFLQHTHVDGSLHLFGGSSSRGRCEIRTCIPPPSRLARHE